MELDQRIMTVHAHPDDEASKGASTIAKYASMGARAVLVCCTGGEAGDVLNPAMQRPDVEENLAEVRREELQRSADIIGYHRVAMLGYRDSGMPDMEENKHPDAFANAPLDDAVGRLVGLIREERPHVLVTYSDHQRGYLHPDHLRVNDISLPAFEAAADPEAYPEHGEPWAIAKLYYTTWSHERMLKTHEKCMDVNGESPFGEEFLKRESEDHLVTTRVEIEQFWNERCDALLAHATQVDPNEKFWFPLPRDVAAATYPYDDYELARSRVDATPTAENREDDLFAGIPQDWGVV